MPRARVGAALLALCSVGQVAADDPPVAPAPPASVRYRGPDEVETDLRAAASARSGWSVVEYGRSAGGRPLLALEIGPAGRPTVLVHGGLSWNDAAGSAACLHLVERLAGGEGNPADSVSWLIVPAPNPDGLAAFLAGRPREGGGAIDRDLDGARGEDGPDDLDGDGEIRRMRRRSTRGAFAPDEAPPKEGKAMGDARLLAEKGPDARRTDSFEVFDEGIDDDGDGEVNEDPPGLDLSRQMAGWEEGKGPWEGEGPFPGIAPETKALMDLSLARTSLFAWYGFASEGPWLLRASESGKVADDDDAVYGKVAEALKVATGQETKKASESGGRPNPGSDLDWAAAHLGILAFRIPVWRIAKEEGNGRERAAPDELDWLLWNDRVLAGAGFAPWKAFEHPTLGPVEIGGWRRFTRREPPADLLAAAVASVSAAPLVHVPFRPVLEIEIETQALGEGIRRVRVRARNRGDGPTDLPSAEKRRRAMGVRATFSPSGTAVVVAGPRSADLGVLAAGGVSGEAVWLVRRPGAGPLGSVTLRHRVAGTLTREIDE